MKLDHWDPAVDVVQVRCIAHSTPGRLSPCHHGHWQQCNLHNRCDGSLAMHSWLAAQSLYAWWCRYSVAATSVSKVLASHPQVSAIASGALLSGECRGATAVKAAAATAVLQTAAVCNTVPCYVLQQSFVVASRRPLSATMTGG